MAAGMWALAAINLVIAASARNWFSLFNAATGVTVLVLGFWHLRIGARRRVHRLHAALRKNYRLN